MDKRDTLYCFKLNKNTGDIDKIEITDYEAGSWTGNKRFYRFKLKSNTFYAFEKELNKFKNDRVYSFSGDMDHAISIITQALITKRDKADKEYQKYNKRVMYICSKYLNNSEVAT